MLTVYAELKETTITALFSSLVVVMENAPLAMLDTGKTVETYAKHSLLPERKNAPQELLSIPAPSAYQDGG